MAKPNYQFEKRQRDLRKKQKQDEKRQRKMDAKRAENETPGTSDPNAGLPPAPVDPAR